MSNSIRKILLVCACFMANVTASNAAILVYDHNSINSYAETAANNLSGSVTVANSSNFNTLLTSGTWDVVLLDMPSSTPGNFVPLINYINGGGKVAMSYWDWDGAPGLVTAFGAISTTNDFSWGGQTLVDTGATGLFAGITMPHSSWSNFWGDDGDAFGFTMASGTIGAAKLASFADSVIILGNSGRTIAAPVLDEWSGAGAVKLWENMITTLQSPTQPVPEPSTLTVFGLGGLGLVLGAIRRRFRNAN